MNHPCSILNNEKGSAIVIALLVLSVLTIIGISSTNISTTELGIVRNEQIYQINFYLAESSAYEAAVRLERESDTTQLIPGTSGHNWLNDDTTDNSDASQFDANATYSAVAKGVRGGSSLDMGSTRLYEFAVFGRSAANNGAELIEIGYLKRF